MKVRSCGVVVTIHVKKVVFNQKNYGILDVVMILGYLGTGASMLCVMYHLDVMMRELLAKNKK